MFSRRKTPKLFQARSSSRDTETDTARLKVVDSALDKILVEAQAERDGPVRRLADVVARASMTIGNNTDEYRTRDPKRDAQQSAINADIKYAELRLQKLAGQLELYQELKLRVVGTSV